MVNINCPLSKIIQHVIINLILGLAAQYASWRVMQFVVGIFGLTALGIIWTFLPETTHPGARGVDKLRQKAEPGKVRWTQYIVNPLSPLWLLRAPNIVAVVSEQ